jgi:outer membrane protein
MKPVWWMIAAVLVANVALAESVQKIGYVDLQRALLESDAGKKAEEEFKGQAEKVRSKLKKQKDEIDHLRDRSERKSPGMAEAERAKLGEDYRKKARDFESNVREAQADLQKKEKELTGGIFRDLQAIIRQYGQEQGYTVILGTVAYGAKNADVTDAIIQRYNSEHASNKKEK